ncbi:hypothetical protein [Pedobacter endophyticus]|uniref:Uncharacterized protein n=1 Tax=Pedobacter endophyticus TaxID=2789740 RepID=A0A7S9KYW3_9SPHI|nr:hypothetical protein [Pedobacter endophyticus]QPH39385.1 hypothetical protein IZT61_20465 [Pedobacter endophyticus]
MADLKTKPLLDELGLVMKIKSNEMPNKKTLKAMKRTFKGERLTKTNSHADLMQKLNA